MQEKGKQPAHRTDPRHVARKHEKEYKGEQETVVHRFQRMAVGEQQNGGNDGKPHPIWDAAEHDGDGNGKQNQIQCRPFGIKDDLTLVRLHRLGLHEYDAKQGDQKNGKHERRCHDLQKFSVRYAEF